MDWNHSADLITRIEESMDSFSKSQKLLARFIISEYDRAAYMTASALGAEVGVSESTVVRFANEMGFEGYPQFQQQIRESVRVRLTSVQRINVANEKSDGVELIHRVLAADAERIRSTIDTIDTAEFERAMDMILKARNIYILGMRSSAILAEFMNYYFELLFDNVRLIRPAGGGEIFEHIMKLREDDVLISISFPRYTRGTAYATQYAAETGAGVIAITDNMSSPIVPHSDVALIVKSEMASFVDSLVAPMSLINAMIAYIGKKKQPEVTSTLERLENVWREYNVYTNGYTDEGNLLSKTQKTNGDK